MTEALKPDSLEKGKLYVIVQDESWMMGNLGEYHSSFPRKSDEEPLHNMVFRDASDSLEMTIVLSDEILGVAPNGSSLGDTINLRSAGITVKGDSDGDSERRHTPA
jgi:hypothetical protein